MHVSRIVSVLSACSCPATVGSLAGQEHALGGFGCSHLSDTVKTGWGGSLTAAKPWACYWVGWFQDRNFGSPLNSPWLQMTSPEGLTKDHNVWSPRCKCPYCPIVWSKMLIIFKNKEIKKRWWIRSCIWSLLVVSVSSVLLTAKHNYYLSYHYVLLPIAKKWHFFCFSVQTIDCKWRTLHETIFSLLTGLIKDKLAPHWEHVVTWLWPPGPPHRCIQWLLSD